MTGGYAYILDLDGTLEDKLNYSYVILRRLKDREEYEELRGLISKHADYTGSPWAKEILNNFDAYVEKFYKIIPLEQCKRDELGESDECESEEIRTENSV